MITSSLLAVVITLFRIESRLFELFLSNDLRGSLHNDFFHLVLEDPSVLLYENALVLLGSYQCLVVSQCELLAAKYVLEHLSLL